MSGREEKRRKGGEERRSVFLFHKCNILSSGSGPGGVTDAEQERKEKSVDWVRLLINLFSSNDHDR